MPHSNIGPPRWESDAGLAHFQAAYPAKGEGGSVTKEDLFYYIDVLLHSPDYRSRYADELVASHKHFAALRRAPRFQPPSVSFSQLERFSLPNLARACTREVHASSDMGLRNQI